MDAVMRKEELKITKDSKQNFWDVTSLTKMNISSYQGADD